MHKFLIDGPSNPLFSFAGGWRPKAEETKAGCSEERQGDAGAQPTERPGVLERPWFKSDEPFKTNEDPFLASLGQPLRWNLQ